MCQGRQEGVRIGWQIYSGSSRLEIKDSSNKGRILVRKAIVLLTCPGARLKIVDTANVLSPGHLSRLENEASQLGNSVRMDFKRYHLVKFAVLDHHGVDDTQKAFIRREQTSPSG